MGESPAERCVREEPEYERYREESADGWYREERKCVDSMKSRGMMVLRGDNARIADGRRRSAVYDQ